jgi:hypothetical protein
MRLEEENTYKIHASSSPIKLHSQLRLIAIEEVIPNACNCLDVTRFLNHDLFVILNASGFFSELLERASILNEFKVPHRSSPIP